MASHVERVSVASARGGDTSSCQSLSLWRRPPPQRTAPEDSAGGARRGRGETEGTSPGDAARAVGRRLAAAEGLEQRGLPSPFLSPVVMVQEAAHDERTVAWRSRLSGEGERGEGGEGGGAQGGEGTA